MVARHLYYIAKQNIESSQTLRLFAGINLLHDTVEAALWAAAAYKGVGRDRAELMQLYDDVSNSLVPKNLSFRSSVVQLNRVRVNSKHYGICPDRKETERLLASMTEFLRETTTTVFDINFWTVSLLSLLRDGEQKDVLAKAQTFFDEGNYLQTVTECRKVIYLSFESWYTIDKFRDPAKAGGGLGAYSKAPYYCRNVEWIRENVKDPFDYIVLAHEDLDKDLLTRGIDPATFWNIWRGTPTVFRYDGTTQWLVKRELEKEVSGATEDHAAYILEQTIDIALRNEEYWRRVRSLGRSGNFVVRLKGDGINVYAKADRSSTVSAVTTAGLREIGVTGSTIGLNDEGPYWKVVHSDIESLGRWYSGYIHNDDIDWSKSEETA
jgi:hypothetical protein